MAFDWAACYGLGLAALIQSEQVTPVFMNLFVEPKEYHLGTFGSIWKDWHSVGCAFVGLVNLAVARDVDKTDFAAGGRAKIAFCSAFIFFVWGAQNTYFCIMRQDVFKKFMWFNALACLGTAALSFHAGVSQ
ncbi:unnamed protein product [Effrenium voratum]|uniref:Uncharacterized protein n=1 Tax=Effrenium voratum TaxID=2562239 RepID=A0AA36J4E5_9DINO|nr:unnamed protein product [Effrenium voratum]